MANKNRLASLQKEIPILLLLVTSFQQQNASRALQGKSSVGQYVSRGELRERDEVQK